jgi:hypothetical protein
VGGFARRGDQHAESGGSAFSAKLRRFQRRAVRGKNADLIRDAEGIQAASRRLHNRKIAVGSDHNRHFFIFWNLLLQSKGRALEILEPSRPGLPDVVKKIVPYFSVIASLCGKNSNIFVSLPQRAAAARDPAWLFQCL